MTNQDRAAVDRLLQMYASYKQMALGLSDLSQQVAKQKLLGGRDKVLEQEFQKKTDALQTLSNEMTFANPVVWIMYKRLAYEDEPQPIKTYHDFRLHCAKPGYICTNRYIFLNRYLASSGLPELSDHSAYPDEKDVREILEDNAFINAIKNTDFQTQWDAHEYHKIDNRVAKWENFA